MKHYPSVSMRFFELLLNIRGNSFKAKGFPKFRSTLERRAYPSPAPMPRKFRRLFHVDEQNIRGQRVWTLSPLHDQQPVHIIYTHGGAYVNPLVSQHWDIIGELVKRVGASVTVPIYPLAPEHTYQETFALLADVYTNVLHNHPDHKMVLCGDSAGGGLALAQAIHYRDLGLPLPDRILLFSPWLDITLSNPDAAAIEPQDVMLGIPGLIQCGRWWAGGDDPRTPLLSPLYGNLTGLPPVDVFIGTAELFLPDARKLKDKISATGGSVSLKEYPGAFHVFVVAVITPEARDVFEHITRTLACA